MAEAGIWKLTGIKEGFEGRLFNHSLLSGKKSAEYVHILRNDKMEKHACMY
jgi:hypothetical protein